MAANNQVQQMRQVAKARRQAATRKVARLERAGLKVAGTAEDPRKGHTDINKMNSAQLKSYIGKLDKFTSRNNQYVRGNNGAPIQRSKWRSYKRLEAQYNSNADNAFEAVKDIRIDRANMTIGERQNMLGVREFPRAANPATNSPFNKMDRKPGGIPNNAAVDKLTRDMKKRTSGDFFKNEAKRLKSDIVKFFNNVGGVSDQMLKEIQRMTPKQIHALNLTNFSNAVSTKYELLKRHMQNRNDEFAAKVADDSTAEAEDLVRWARKIK